MLMTFFLLPRAVGTPHYLAEAPAGRDAGASVDYSFVVEPGPNGARDVVSLLRQVAISLRGTAVLEVDLIADERVLSTEAVFVQPVDPAAPAEAWLAEDTFEETTDSDMENHVPTLALSSVEVGFGSYSYNANSLAPNVNDMVAHDYDMAGVGLNNDKIMRSRCSQDIVGPDEKFRVYSSFGRASVCFFGVRAGVRILVDGTDPDDTEKDGIDIYLVDNGSCDRGHLQVDEYVDGSLVGTRSFYTDTATDDLPWGLSDADPYGLAVLFTPGAGVHGYGQIQLVLGGSHLTEGAYVVPTSPLTLYTTGDVPADTYDLVSDRSDKKRFGAIVSGRTSGTGTVRHMAVSRLAVVPGDWWIDTTTSPYTLKKRHADRWRVIPDRARDSGRERDLELPANQRFRKGAFRIRVTRLLGDFSVGSWALGVRPLRGRI